MQISLVIAEGTKQVMFTPETEHEQQALEWIAPEDTLEAVAVWGTYDDKPSHYSYNTAKSQGGYLRRYATKNSLMFVINEKPKKPVLISEKNN